MALSITTETLDQRQLALRVTVDQSRVDAELRKAARKVAGQYRIPGFRKGKAPYHLVVQYVGLPALFEEFLEDLGKEVYQQALSETGIEPYAVARLDVDSLDPLVYKYIVPLDPEIDLGDYRNLRVEEPPIEITDEEIAAKLESYRREYAESGPVDRPCVYGDLLTIDVKSVIPAEGENGEEIVVLDETEWQVTPDEENPMDPPGFDQALLGMRPGEEKEFTLAWPADSQSIYAGKQAHFRVKLHKIEGEVLPELNDEFAQMVGPDFQTLDDLKASIRASLLEERKAEAEDEYLGKVLDALIAQSKLVYPPVVVEDQIDVMISEMERQLRQYGIESAESYIRQMGMEMDAYRESLRPQAETIARRNLVISELYRKEGLTVSEEEIDARIDRMVGPAAEEGSEERDASRQALRTMMRTGGGRAVLESQILREKALDRLLAIARGEELPPLPVEPVAGAADSTDGAPSVTESSAEEAAPVAEVTANVEANEGESR